ncbi:MAG: membrane protein insertase YidC, partial [Pseudomonadota bacterium]
MSDQRNLFLAIALSLAILLGFQFFVEGPRIERERELQAQRQAEQAGQSEQAGTVGPSAGGDLEGVADGTTAGAPGQAGDLPLPGEEAAAPGSLTRDAALATA